MKKMIQMILVLAVAGCGTAPKVHNFERSRSLQVSRDEAWLSVIDFFTSNSLQIKTIEKDSGIIYAESGSYDSRFADCGDYGLAIPIQNSGEFNVFVRERGYDTEVVVNSTYRQMRRFGNYPPYVVNCNSTGYLEQLVLDSARKSIGAVQPSRGPIATPSTPRSVEAATETPSMPRRVEVIDVGPPAPAAAPAPAPAVEVPAAVQSGDPCAKYKGTPAESRCRLYSGPNGWQHIPPAGRNADLDTQIRCAPFRSNPTSYEQCISRAGGDGAS